MEKKYQPSRRLRNEARNASGEVEGERTETREKDVSKRTDENVLVCDEDHIGV